MEQLLGASKVKKRLGLLPSFLFKSLDPAARKNLRKWKDLVNSGKRMAPEDLVTEEDLKNDKVKDPVPSGKRQSSKKKGKKQCRVTNTVSSGLVDDTIVVRLHSDEESNELETSTQKASSSSRDDSVENTKPGRSNRYAKRIRRNIASIGISKGRTYRHPYAVIDLGAEQEHIGTGWHITYVSERVETLNGAID